MYHNATIMSHYQAIIKTKSSAVKINVNH